VTLTRRSPMRTCGFPYASRADAVIAASAGTAGDGQLRIVPPRCCCGQYHVRKLPDARKPWLRGVAFLRAAGSATEGKSAARKGSGSGRSKPFPPAVAALLDARDPWCVHCGSVDGLQRHHRRLKGIGGDGRDHTQCACNGVRLCWLCHSWAHSGKGQGEARAEGLIIARATLEPFRESVLARLKGDVGGLNLWPQCDGTWAYGPPAGGEQ
jgi:hypothetical protein